MSYRIACPTSSDDPHDVDWILATCTWHCPKCQTCGDVQDGVLTLTAVNAHSITDEERTVWARFYASALIDVEATA